MRPALLLFGMVLLSLTSFGQGQIQGVVLNANGTPLPFVDVRIVGTMIGSATLEDGTFLINGVEAGAHYLEVSSIGMQRKEIEVEVLDGEATTLDDITLNEDMLGLDEVVITGTMRETFVKASPIKVEVITSKTLTKSIPAMNLMDGLQLINGVQEVVACGVCFTNSISINGLPGPYTAVLMDGSPIYGSLASVYGLNGIPTQMVDRFEIVKGPSSTLYGSEAIAGVINIITKDPENQPMFSADLLGTSHGEAFGNIATAFKIGKWTSHTGVNYAYMNRFEDDNGDGFSDIVGMDRLSVVSKWKLERPDYKNFTLTARVYVEDRRNGTEQYLQDRSYRELRGNDSIYGESIYTERAEVFGSYDLPGKENIRLDYSLSWHDQDSYYGSDHYAAQQGIAFTNLVWIKKFNKHVVTSGLTNRYQYYDDNTVATDAGFNNEPPHSYIPGIFAEDEVKLFERWTVLGGMRLDYYQQHGFIPAPRLSSKFDIDPWTAIRLNAGTGFKVVNLFTEDHAFVTGQREVVIEEALNPERSWNVSSNFNHTHALFGTSGMIDVDAFYTRFQNKITPDYDTPGQIIYANSDGYAQTYGASFSFSQQFSIPIAYRVGLNYNHATITERNDDGILEEEFIEFAPRWSGVAVVNYTISKWKLDLAYTANLTGPMALPEVYDLNDDGDPVGDARPTSSDPFITQTIQFTKRFQSKLGLEFYGGVQNFMDYRQPMSPLVGVNDPSAPAGFSPFFDTSYAYAPIHGREWYFGLRFNLDRS